VRALEDLQVLVRPPEGIVQLLGVDLVDELVLVATHKDDHRGLADLPDVLADVQFLYIVTPLLLDIRAQLAEHTGEQTANQTIGQ
jgi:hypothetical protein